MFSSKKYKIKKGFILLQTVLIGIICLAGMLYIFEGRIIENKYTIRSNKYILKVDSDNRYNEHLFVLMNEYINNHKKILETKGISEYFSNLKEQDIVNYDRGKVRYYKKNHFKFIMPYENSEYKVDIYEMKILNGAIKYMFMKTEYINLY